jgi:hypothetical protein
MKSVAIDLAGQEIGRLRVLARAGSDEGGRALWRCICECGRETVVRGKDLRSGNTRSCGCLALERTAEMGAATRRHGETGTATYRSWVAMRRRCHDPGDKDYPSYGGRGVTVCERWGAFENFLADMGERPPGATLDRFPRKDGNYEPGNCRWASARDQANNRRDNHLLTIGDDTASLTEWARRSGLSTRCIWHRLRRGLAGRDLLAPSRKRGDSRG